MLKITHNHQKNWKITIIQLITQPCFPMFRIRRKIHQLPKNVYLSCLFHLTSVLSVTRNRSNSFFLNFLNFCSQGTLSYPNLSQLRLSNHQGESRQIQQFRFAVSKTAPWFQIRVFSKVTDSFRCQVLLDTIFWKMKSAFYRFFEEIEIWRDLPGVICSFFDCVLYWVIFTKGQCINTHSYVGEKQHSRANSGKDGRWRMNAVQWTVGSK